MEYKQIDVLFTDVKAHEIEGIEQRFNSTGDRPKRRLVVEQIDGSENLRFNVIITVSRTALDPLLEDALHFIKLIDS